MNENFNIGTFIFVKSKSVAYVYKKSPRIMWVL